MVMPKVEIAFLIYNFEFNKLRICEQSEIIKELNRKINKYGAFALQSSYKYVNNFSYTTKVFHSFFKLAEYYLFKYFNSIIVDSIFFFNCINEIKNNPFYDIQKEDENNQINFNQNGDGEKKENMDLENKIKGDNDYSFDCRVLHLFIEHLKRTYNKSNEKKFSKDTNNNKNMNHNNDNIKKINVEKENQNKKENNSLENLKFRKGFLYELCEINDSFHNKKNRMIIITKIFRKIINRNKIRYFICENDKIKKKNYLKFFLNLSLGIFIYIYMYKYIKKNYKNVDYFIFLNNLKNIRQIYINNSLYLEKNQVVSFIKYIKFINIQIFRYIYISFFVDIYKYINLIYNLTILSLFNYFKYLYEKNKEESVTKKNESPKMECNLKDLKIINDDKSMKENNTNHGDEKYAPHDISLSKNTKIEDKESSRDVGKEKMKQEKYDDTNRITIYSSGKYEGGENKKREQNISYLFNENYNFKLNTFRESIPLKTSYSYSIENKRDYINELIYDCYIYVLVFFKYIKTIRKKMKSKIIKIQKHIKKMIEIFVKIYNLNNIKGKDRKRPLNKDIEKKENCYGISENKDSIDSYMDDDALHFLYFTYIELSKNYKNCVKINYKIIKLVHMFHLLLGHFYKYFPVFHIHKENCIIYNYYNKYFIYKEMEKEKDNMRNLKERKGDRNGEETFDIFKNVADYELEFFYFSNRKNEDKQTIHDLVENNEVESFDLTFNKNMDGNFSLNTLKQFKEEEREENMEEEKEDEDYKEKPSSNKTLWNSKKLFLYCINNHLDHYLINVNIDKVSFEDYKVKYKDRKDIEKKNNNFTSNISNISTMSTEKEKNILTSQNKNKILSLFNNPILEVLKNNKNIYHIILEIIENFCDNKLSFIKNFIADLNRYNKNILEIYNDNIFDVYYKLEKDVPYESDELIKNKKLLEVKIFLDYEKIYTKKTVETQTQISLFKKDKSMQISKDKEVSTTSEQIIQTKEISNPIFYLKDIYD